MPAATGSTRRKSPSWGGTWPRALVVASVVAIALWLLLGQIPSRMMAFLDERGMDPRLRDAVVASAFTIGFAFVAWVLRRLQRIGRI